MRKYYYTVAFMLASLSVQGQNLSLYCESGEPSGVGPTLYVDLNLQEFQVDANVELNINSVDPVNRKPNTTIKRHQVIKNSTQSHQWFLVLSNSYQVQISKVQSGHDVYWQALVGSRTNKFSAIELNCQ